MRVVAYYRVSTEAQGKSGLGLESQQEYIRIAAEQASWEVIASFEDHLSGTLPPMDREGLRKALELCKTEGATLVVAKLDRLSRDVADIALLMKLVDFKVATMPYADKFQLHIYAALAEQERDFISTRTKVSLAALQKRADEGNAEALAKVDRRNSALLKGHKTGLPASLKARKDKADQYARSIEDSILACKARGLNTLQGVADCLNSKGLTTPRGASFTAMTVSRLVTKLNIAL
ncbi:recombinase family protein [Pseudomonas sp. MS15a(2019)]|uniref:recombinase family protein n=1 Tax=Pseudomonas sp. MS15a(2019) TaxID=2579938 RepID=UPI00156795D8|nr:recombinase family protein [Pseudomonas sp. MS15a(2019)]NRH40645.1 recombinase family protein [Pseudomonas sp. MS15a(2019)]